MATPAIRNLIREGKTHQIYSAMQAGAQHGMHTLDQHLAELVRTGSHHATSTASRSATTSRTSTASRSRLRGADMATATKTFEYSVRDRKGKLVNGKLEAASEAALVQKLRGMGYAPVNVREAGTGMNREHHASPASTGSSSRTWRS